MLVAKEWLLDDPETTFAAVRSRLDDPLRFHTPYASIFAKRMAITTVYASNALEHTLPSATTEHEAYKLLEELYDCTDGDEPVDITWDAEGHGNGKKSLRAQLMQHMRALKYVMACSTKPLSVAVVLRAHELLMDGAVDERNVRVLNGVFRNTPRHSGSHTYPKGDPVALREMLEGIVVEYNKNLAAKKTPTYFVEVPARLFYDIITLHPFENGNGRLSRLMFAFALLQVGVPFPVLLSSGHSNARSHYMRAIMKARCGHMEELNTMALSSIDCTLCNYYENERMNSHRA